MVQISRSLQIRGETRTGSHSRGGVCKCKTSPINILVTLILCAISFYVGALTNIDMGISNNSLVNCPPSDSSSNISKIEDENSSHQTMTASEIDILVNEKVQAGERNFRYEIT